jgi:hypothetical protein
LRIIGAASSLFGRSAMHRHRCEYCGSEFEHRKEDVRFCQGKCRAAWHREHDPSGAVSGCRRLKSGAVSVTVKFEDNEAERAMRFMPRQRVVLGAIRESE